MGLSTTAIAPFTTTVVVSGKGGHHLGLDRVVAGSGLRPHANGEPARACEPVQQRKGAPHGFGHSVHRQGSVDVLELDAGEAAWGGESG